MEQQINLLKHQYEELRIKMEQRDQNKRKIVQLEEIPMIQSRLDQFDQTIKDLIPIQNMIESFRINTKDEDLITGNEEFEKNIYEELEKINTTLKSVKTLDMETRQTTMEKEIQWLKGQTNLNREQIEQLMLEQIPKQNEEILIKMNELIHYQSEEVKRIHGQMHYSITTMNSLVSNLNKELDNVKMQIQSNLVKLYKITNEQGVEIRRLKDPEGLTTDESYEFI
jgi:hypothetical protein